MQHDSAAAAVNFVSLPRHRSPVARLGPLQFNFWLFSAPKVRRKGRIQRSDTWAGDGCRSVSQSGAKRVSLSLPTTDFRRASASP